jgi:glutamate racemase
VHGEVQRELPEVRLVHVLDETLLIQFARVGGVNAEVRRKVVSMARSLEEAGAGAILVTCSSLGNVVYEARNFVEIPVMKVDEPMVEEAVARGGTVGVLATSISALRGTGELIEVVAGRAGRTRKVEVCDFLCADAAKRLEEGRDEFERYLAREALKASREVDILVVSQLSMTGLTRWLPDECSNVLTALPYAVNRLKPLMGQ